MMAAVTNLPCPQTKRAKRAERNCAVCAKTGVIKMKLYEIDNAIMECIDDETGEVIDFERLEKLNIARRDKLEGVALAIKNLTAEAEAMSKEKQTLEKRRKVINRKIEGYKGWLSKQLEGSKFETARVVCRFKNSSAVNVDKSRFIAWAISHDRDDLLRFKEPEPDKDAIREEIEDNQHIPGCELVQKLNITLK